MKTNTKGWVVMILAMFIATSISAQTFHAIIACNTTDSKIGDSMTSDMKNMRNAAEIIAANLDCDNYDEYVFDGTTCTRSNITKCISDMEVGRDDVILFFYGGHGTHALNNSDDPWPQMCMNTNIESLYMPLASLDKLLSNKQPKLRVILTNCCNKEHNGVSIKPLYAQSADATSLSLYNSAAFKKLFLENSGKVIMTSSKLGQLSWCYPNGGLFTNNLMEMFEAIGTDKLSPTWDIFCKSVHDKTLAYKKLPGGVEQEPYYVINLNDSDKDHSNNVSDSRTKDEKRNSSATQSANLFNALQTLVNRSYTEDQRLSKIDAIQSKYFTSDAHVVTVGRDGTSKIMYEDIADFLRRLALSSHIKQINLLEGDNHGKNSIITVHEVRY